MELQGAPDAQLGNRCHQKRNEFPKRHISSYEFKNPYYVASCLEINAYLPHIGLPRVN